MANNNHNHCHTVVPGPINSCEGIKEAVCIQVDKIYDSCREKDCLQDLRVYFSRANQDLIDRAINVKCHKSEVIWVFTDIEEVPFDRGFYTVDIKFFFKVTLNVFTGLGLPTQIEGLATFDKKVILFGSEGEAKKFTTVFTDGGVDTEMPRKSNGPKAIVEVVDPICLSARLADVCECECIEAVPLPATITDQFADDFVIGGELRIVLVSLGLFTIVKIEREVQLLIPVFDFCVPQNTCIAATDENPCELFDRIKFPVTEFYPLQIQDFPGATENATDRRHCCK